MTENHVFEKKVLEQFVKLYNQGHEHSIQNWNHVHPQSNSEPDGKITHNDQVKGIEIKRIFFQHEATKFRIALCSEIQAQCPNLCRAAYLNFQQSKLKIPKAIFIQKVAEMINRYHDHLDIQDILIWDTPQSDLIAQHFPREAWVYDKDIAPYVSTIDFGGSAPVVRSGNDSVGDFKDIGLFLEDTIQNAEKKKVKKDRPLSEYKIHFSFEELWLIISFEDTLPSSWFGIYTDTNLGPYETTFDRIFVLDMNQQVLKEVLCQSPQKEFLS
ncbi:MAG: hypothetical protein AB7F28_08880 [Candidatus Margulisiibacteriota bacterium]